VRIIEELLLQVNRKAVPEVAIAAMEVVVVIVMVIVMAIAQEHIPV
jgi:hypothetical protein